MESGPFRVDGKGGLVRIDGGWEEYATMVFGMFAMQIASDFIVVMIMSFPVDQPAGTGLSYTSTDKYVHELAEVGYVWLF